MSETLRGDWSESWSAARRRLSALGGRRHPSFLSCPLVEQVQCREKEKRREGKEEEERRGGRRERRREAEREEMTCSSGWAGRLYV